MYTEEYERRTFPIRDFLLKIIIIVLIVFLVIWLLPKFLKPTTTNVVDLSPLTERIFADNLGTMKDAAISYYTTERLPKEIGDSDKMTLRDMIGKKLLMPFVDKYGKACSVDDSYVEITKMDNEYLLKVNLECSKEEDYILVHLGCYNYCDSDVCEKKDTVVAKGASFPSGGSYSGGQAGGDVTVDPGKDPTPSDPGKDPTPGKPDDPGKPDNPDNPDNPNNPDKPDNPVEQDKYEYEYKKTTGAKMSAWTSWSAWQKNTAGYKAIDCSTSDPTCLKQIQILERKEQNGTYKEAYTASRQELRQYGSYQEKSCANYEYVRINETTYTTTKTYGRVTTLSTSGVSSGDWVYVGDYVGYIAPSDTATKRYVRAGYNYSCDGCSSTPKYTYKVYEYHGGLTNVTTGSTTTTQLLSSNTVKNTNTSIKVSCSNIVTKTIPVYRTVTVYEKAYRDAPYYATKVYYSVRTRKLLEKGKTTTKWSDSSNDQTLISQGYYYTGNKRKK